MRLACVTLGFYSSTWLCTMGWCVWRWIKIGCTNNNYASREKFKKCGQPMELAAMPALAIPAASLQTHPHYFSRVQHQRLNFGSLANGAIQHPLPLSPNWLLGGPDKFGGQPASNWPLGPTNTVPYANQVSQVIVPKGWLNGDWICTYGFHSYSSRAPGRLSLLQGEVSTSGSDLEAIKEQNEVDDLKHRISLMEAVMEGSKNFKL